jgi:hypothetical protein
MKHISTFLMLLIPFSSFSQKKLPVINASSDKAKIYEQGNPVSNWYINPKVKLDAFTTNKLIKSKTVKFKTDIDSISFKLKPGQQKDFIVLLNSKDACLTRIQSPETKDFSKLKPEIHNSIPFFVNQYNTNFLPVVFNGTDSLMLNFDTGATEIDLTTDALKQKVRFKPQINDVSYDIKIGNQTYKSKVYDIAVAGNETDGMLGWNVFDGMIVELDYDNNKMILHSKMPKQVLHNKHYSKFKITYIKNKPFIEAEISQSGTRNKSLFLFDLGYQRTIMLDHDLLQEARFPTEKMEVIKKVIMHGIKGNEVPVITSNLESLKIGNFELKNVPAQIMGQNKPMPGVNIHILGSDILKRFNTILDFQKNVIYLKPNHLFDLEYADQKKSS